jgi:hypothetical protein
MKTQSFNFKMWNKGDMNFVDPLKLGIEGAMVGKMQIGNFENWNLGRHMKT